jgi:hypothetical protein
MSLTGTRSLVTSALRRTAAVVAQQRRTMASDRHSKPKPNWTGIDKVVRTYFPEDWQLGYAVFAFYGSLILYFSMGKKKPKKQPAEEAAPAETATATH